MFWADLVKNLKASHSTSSNKAQITGLRKIILLNIGILRFHLRQFYLVNV